jgi:hypothetical protein
MQSRHQQPHCALGWQGVEEVDDLREAAVAQTLN